jgi:outer membrane protein TolC
MRPVLLFVLGALSATAVEAQQRLTILDAVNAALAADPAAGVSRADVAAARAGEGEARAALKPDVQFGGSVFYYEEPMIVTPIHAFLPTLLPEFDRTLIQSNLTASYMLYDGGAARARVRQSSASLAAATAALDATAGAVAARTAALYFSVLSRARTLAAHDLRIEALDGELARVRQLRAVGRIAEVDVLRAEAARAAAEADRTAVAADLDLVERTLARAASLPPETTRAVNLAPASIDEPLLDRPLLEQKVVEASPAVRQARDRVRAQEAAIAVARSGNRPRLQAVGSLLEFGSSQGQFAFEWNAGAQLRWSVFDGGAADERVAQARAALQRAQEQVRLAEKDAHDAIDRAMAEHAEARATADSLAAAVERFQEVVRVEKLRLEIGVGTQTDYLRAEADLLGGRASLAAARYRSMIASVEIARLTGDLGAEWIAAVARSEQ